MQHDNVHLITGNGERIEFIRSIDPPVRDDYDHWVNAEKRFGTLKHIEFIYSGIKIWLTHYQLSKDTKLRLSVKDLSCLSLTYIIGDDIHYSIKGLADGVSKNGFFNMIYLSDVEVEYKIKRGRTIIMFGIDFPGDALIKSGVPPVLSAMVDSMLAGKTALMSKGTGDYLILGSMKPTIERLSADLYTGKISAKYPLIYLINTLVFNSFEAAGMYGEDNQSKDIVLLKVFIDEHLSTVTVPELVDRFPYNRATLRLLFIKHTGMNAFDYIIETRLLKGEQLLTQTTDPIKSIAVTVGYKNGASFSTAFNRRFSIWPRQARRSAMDLPPGKKNK